MQKQNAATPLDMWSMVIADAAVPKMPALLEGNIGQGTPRAAIWSALVR